MRKYIVFNSTVDAEAYQSTVDKLMGWPAPGVHIGGGRHVDMTTPERLGWTIHEDEVRKHPSKAQWRHLSVDPDERGDKAKLSEGELAQLRAQKPLEQELGEDWDEQGEGEP